MFTGTAARLRRVGGVGSATLAKENMESWWNGAGTGAILIGLGALAFLPPYLSSRRTGAPFVEPRMIGGYNGVVGIVTMAAGVVILVVSLIGLAWLYLSGR